MQFLVNPRTKQAQPVVKIYGNRNFEGPCQALESGKYTIMQLNIGQNEIGSIKIPDGLMVALHRDSDSPQQVNTFTTDVPDLAGVFTEQPALIAIQPAVMIFRKRNYQGESRNLAVGRYNGDMISLFKPGMSSIKVPKGMMITFFKDSDYHEPVACFTENTPDARDAFDFDANVSGVAVEAIKANPFGDALSFGDIVALKSGKERFMRIKTDNTLIADSEYIEEENEFAVVRTGSSRHTIQASFGDCISLKTRDGKYLKVDKDGALFAGSDTISDAERFILWRSGDTKHLSYTSGDDTISLQSLVNNGFVNSDDMSGIKSEKIDAGEKWRVVISEKRSRQIRF